MLEWFNELFQDCIPCTPGTDDCFSEPSSTWLNGCLLEVRVSAGSPNEASPYWDIDFKLKYDAKHYSYTLLNYAGQRSLIFGQAKEDLAKPLAEIILSAVHKDVRGDVEVRSTIEHDDFQRKFEVLLAQEISPLVRHKVLSPDYKSSAYRPISPTDVAGLPTSPSPSPSPHS